MSSSDQENQVSPPSLLLIQHFKQEQQELKGATSAEIFGLVKIQGSLHSSVMKVIRRQQSEAGAGVERAMCSGLRPAAAARASRFHFGPQQESWLRSEVVKAASFPHVPFNSGLILSFCS